MTANKISWLGHASIRIEGEKTIYLDPWNIGVDLPAADLVLITHSHYDHCSAGDVEKIRSADTVIYAPADCEPGLGPAFIAVKPGWKGAVGGVSLEAVPAYNLEKKFHPRSNNWVGYIIEMGGERIYVAGDTDAVPEMDAVKADVVVVPVGGTYTMNAEEAAAAVDRIGPSLAIPVHFGEVVGTRRDAEKFKELCRTPVEILPVT